MTVIPFQPRERSKSPEQNSTTPPTDFAAAAETMAAAFADAGIESYFLQVVVPISEHLRSLEGTVPRRLVEDNKTALLKLTDDELKEVGWNSDNLQWSKHPAFFQAFIETATERDIT